MKGDELIMGGVQTFKFGNQRVRTLVINNEPYFVGRDVTHILGYSRASNAIFQHVSEDDTLKWGLIDSIGRLQKSIFVNESGLYSLILSSKLKTAQKFKQWVTREVLPSIRKHGTYLTDKKAYDIIHDKNELADMLIQAGKQLKNANEKIKNMESKAAFYDAVSSSNSTITIGELAKILYGNGVKMGQKQLYKWLRDSGYLIKQKCSERNLPTQRAMDLGLFKVKEYIIHAANGEVTVCGTTLVTGKGQTYFISKLTQKND